MQSHKHLTLNIFLLLVFLSGLMPACSATSSPVSDHDQENALLLQIASHVRLSGEPDLNSYAQLNPEAFKLAFIRPFVQAGTTTELDILVDLYTTYMSRLQSSGNLTDRNIDRIERQLQTKIQRLNNRSQQLKSRRRRRRGLAGFFRRVGRAIGKFVRTVGRGIGKAAEYLIEEVAPEVIRDMVLTGQPLTARVFWKGVRKVVRSRIKNAVGRHLARQGVPMVILEKAGLDGELTMEGEGDESQEGDGQDQSETESQPSELQIGYGNHAIDVDESGDSFGYYTWNNYWTNLPNNGIDDCQPVGKSTANVTAYMEDFQMELDFELDSGQLSGSLEGDGAEDFTYEINDYVFAGFMEDGWVRPDPEANGWIFGGTFNYELSMHGRWRCFHCVPVEGGCDIVVKWLEDEKTAVITAELGGWTEQVVQGDDEEPDRLVPGGIYTVNVSYEGSDGDLLFGCEDCSLPEDFPPPVYIQE